MANEPSSPRTPEQVTLLNTDRQMSTVRFSPCGEYLVAAGRDTSIRLWKNPGPIPAPDAPAAEPDPKAKKPVKKPARPEPKFEELAAVKEHNGWVGTLEFHPTAKRFFSADSWGRLCAWKYDAEPVSLAWKIDAAHDGWLRQLAVSPDGERLATVGADRYLRVWATADGKKLHEFDTGEDVLSVAYHPNGKALVTGDLKGVVKQWSTSDGKVERTFDASNMYKLSMIQEVGGVRSLAFDKTGTVLACAGTEPSGGGFVQGVPVAKFFDWETGKEQKTLKLGDNTEVYVHEFRQHPDGFWVGVASGQPGKGKYFFIKPGDEQPFFTSKGTSNCHSLAFHPSGARLAIIGNAGTYGQKRSKAREGDYPGNTSPIHIVDLYAAS